MPIHLQVPKLPPLKANAPWPTFRLDVATRSVIGGGRMPTIVATFTTPIRQPASPVTRLPQPQPQPLSPPTRPAVATTVGASPAATGAAVHTNVGATQSAMPRVYAAETASGRGARTAAAAATAAIAPARPQAPMAGATGHPQVYAPEGNGMKVQGAAQPVVPNASRGLMIYPPEYGPPGYGLGLLPNAPTAPTIHHTGHYGGRANAGSVRPARGAATQVLVLGLLTLILSVLTGVPAIVSGIALLRRPSGIDKRARAKASIGIGIALLAISLQVGVLIWLWHP